jgi:hypothetical protein
MVYDFEKIPFTSAYLPGKGPLIETVCIYGAAFGAYVGLLSAVIVFCLQEPPFFLMFFGSLLAIWANVPLGTRRYRSRRSPVLTGYQYSRITLPGGPSPLRFEPLQAERRDLGP